MRECEWLHDQITPALTIEQYERLRSMKISDKEIRDEAAARFAGKMAKSLVEAWRQGKPKLVKRVINNCTSTEMGERWHAAARELLNPEEAVEFDNYMEAE